MSVGVWGLEKYVKSTKMRMKIKKETIEYKQERATVIIESTHI